MNCADTIIAASTPLTAAPRAVVRLSGVHALDIAAKVFDRADLEKASGYSVVEGGVRLDGCQVDCAVYVMRAPRSYTREDVVEFHIPGSPAFAGMLLRALLRAGARLAAPGEFTQRAFLSGRIDLAQAEAVLKIIRSCDEVHHRAGLAQLHGALSRTLKDATEDAARALALVELRIDFSDQDIEYIEPETFREPLRRALEILERLEKSSHLAPTTGVLPMVVLAGRTNAGKSSLVNALVGRSAAIVHHSPGTTRDYIEAHLTVDDVELVLVDTAGGEGPEDHVDLAAMAQARKMYETADIVLVVVDGTQGVGEFELDVVERAGSRAMITMSKCDAAEPEAADKASAALGLPVVESTSAVTGQGLRELARSLAERLVISGGDTGRARMLLTARQMDAVRNAIEHLRAAIDADTEEIISLETREALEHLGLLTGTAIADDTLNRIFTEFCIGK